MTSRNRSTARFFAAGAVLATSLLLGDPAEAQQHQGGRTEQHQTRGNRADRAERRVAQLTQRLQLSADQAARIRRILADERQQLEARRPAGEARPGGEGRARGQQRPAPSPELRAIRERTEQQIGQVLNERQRAEYRKLREERQQHGQGRGQRGERRGETQPRARS